MSWLIWKEYRHNRLIMIVGLVLLVFPYVVAVAIGWITALFAPELRGELPPWTLRMLGAALYSMALGQLTLGLLGGNAIAGERVDRSAEFLAYLPLSKARILSAKIALAAATAAVIWLLNFVVLLALYAGFEEGATPRALGNAWSNFASIATTGLLFFSVAWLLSSLLESPAVSVCVGLITPFLVVTALVLLNLLLAYHGVDGRRWVFVSYYPVCLVLAAASFAAGTWYFLRRVEP